MASETRQLSQSSWPLPRLWAAFLLLLVAATYPLWLVAADSSGYLAIPLFDIGTRWLGVPLPRFVVIAPSLTLIASLISVIAFPRRCRAAWWVVSASLVFSFLLDQHRLQPWAYQSSLYALIFAAMSPSRARPWLILLASSIYLYSAAGKFDYQFTHTVGQEMLEAVARPLGGLPEGIPPSMRSKMALFLPTTEFCAGAGLLIPFTRRAAAVVLILMHVSLIAILGPWSLDHSHGVLIWNVLLIVQAYALVLRPCNRDVRHDATPRTEPVPPAPRTTSIEWVIRAVILVALVAPLFERSGYWDHWLSWSLYSPHTSRAEIEIHRSVTERLGADANTFLEDDEDGDGWQRLSLGRWSLTDRRVPVYPQARYQMSFAAKLAADHHFDDSIRVRLRGAANRWNGQRSEQRLMGRAEIEKALNQFWLTRSSR